MNSVRCLTLVNHPSLQRKGRLVLSCLSVYKVIVYTLLSTSVKCDYIMKIKTHI